MKLVNAFCYYLKSIPTLLLKTNFLIIPFILVKKPLILIIKSRSGSFKFKVNSLMDIWTIKEVILDHCYDKFHQIKKGDIIIDIGASIGDFSIYASRSAKKIYAFDPDTNRSELFKKNRQLNQSKNIVFLKKKVNSLNEIFNLYKIRSCDFLKIDCEGAEYLIFKNTSVNILKKIKYIAFEIHTFNNNQHQSYKALKEKLINNNFILSELKNPVHEYIRYLFALRKN